MFTGIITDIGTIVYIEDREDRYFRVGTSFDTANIVIGASIACSGICLTVIDKENGWFGVEASQETMSLTTAQEWVKGTHVNLEAALKLGDELGGHLVSGHVDGCGTITSITRIDGSWKIDIDVQAELAPFIAKKGSITMDGISLTVNEVQDKQFNVNIIPHTWQQTTLSERKEGDNVNLEIDMMARYVARLMEIRDAA